jgi:ATP-dependent Lon protease
MKKILIINVLCAIALLPACTKQVVVAGAPPASNNTQTSAPAPDIKPSNGVKLAPVKSTDASAMLNFAEEYADLSADMQKQTLAATNQTLAGNPNDLLHRMKLVMIYGLPSSSLLDTPKAQNLLQQILQENILQNDQLAFAHVLFDHFIAINKVNRGYRDEQKQLESLQQKNDALQKKLDASQLKLEAAQQKLESSQQKINELKNIEKSMGSREILPKETAPKDANTKPK